MNIAGPVKDTPLVRLAFQAGLAALDRDLGAPVHRESVAAPTGPEALLVYHRPAGAVKDLCLRLEEQAPVGRLYDLDVLSPGGEKLSRPQARRCLICGGPVTVCSRSRAHGLAAIQAKTEDILWSFAAGHLAQLARQALEDEVCLTPKPGLVDRRNTGAHDDMDLPLFHRSAAALEPYFCRFVSLGMAGASPAELQALGREAEHAMLTATGGVNTHKGAVFSVGIVCAALGRLDRSLWAEAARVLAEVSAMTAGLTEKDFAGVTAENAATVGQKLYIRYGITGVRGQVEAGLPAVLNVGLPVLEEGLAKGYDFDRVGGGALLAILANSTDTNIIARSSRERQLALTEELKALLAQTPYPDKDALAALDDRFIAENLSPGGSADLLALTWLLHFVTTERNIDE
jgi:holo-ACP synthase/triphosphoribosyl-dephospho-CoA synthase